MATKLLVARPVVGPLPLALGGGGKGGQKDEDDGNQPFNGEIEGGKRLIFILL